MGREKSGEHAFEFTAHRIRRRLATATRWTFELPKPATFKDLRMKVLSTVPGKQEWGSISEIEAFDQAGKNLLLSPPRWVTRDTPQHTLEQYRQIKPFDPSRPVFMTLTSGFHPQFEKWPDERRLRMYADFIRAADVIGYDVYPIYGWNKPEWIHLVHDCTQMLAEMAGPNKPLYAWIETSKGGQWTGELANQKEVTPAWALVKDLHGPVLSRRLKLQREGLEEWELLKLAEKKVGRQKVQTIVDRVYTCLGKRTWPPDAYNPAKPMWSYDEREWDKARQEIIDALR